MFDYVKLRLCRFTVRYPCFVSDEDQRFFDNSMASQETASRDVQHLQANKKRSEATVPGPMGGWDWPTPRYRPSSLLQGAPCFLNAIFQLTRIQGSR